MRVRFWGTRGSVASPGPETLRHGGNTSCVEVRTADGTLLIFDCGTGARKLGLSLAGAGPVRAHLFIGHTHADHIQGLPFFLPAFLPGSHLTIYGPAGIDRSLPTAIGGQMEYAYFPVPMTELPSRIDFEELGEATFRIEGIQVRTQYLNHTVPCLAYRMEVGGVSLVYATDHEQHARSLWRPGRREGEYETSGMVHDGDARHAELLRDADVVIHDAQFTAAEYPSRVGWGHSTIQYVLNMALAARVKHLVLYHHDPTRTDEALDALVAECRARVQEARLALRVTAAAEGDVLELAETAALGQADRGPRAPRLPTRARILVADDERTVVRLLEETLRRDGYEVVSVANGAEAVEQARQQPFDLVLLDVEMPVMDGFQALRVLRAEPDTARVPVLMLTARAAREDVIAGFAEGVTDYMVKPFSVSQVRARVRSWLSRAAE